MGLGPSKKHTERRSLYPLVKFATLTHPQYQPPWSPQDKWPHALLSTSNAFDIQRVANSRREGQLAFATTRKARTRLNKNTQPTDRSVNPLHKTSQWSVFLVVAIKSLNWTRIINTLFMSTLFILFVLLRLISSNAYLKKIIKTSKS